MTTDVPLLTVQDCVAAARAFAGRAKGPDGLRRAVTGTSMSAIASMVVLVLQFHDTIETAAAYSTSPDDFELWTDLQNKLVAAGYLPLPQTNTAKEPGHGQG